MPRVRSNLAFTLSNTLLITAPLVLGVNVEETAIQQMKYIYWQKGRKFCRHTDLDLPSCLQIPIGK